MNWMKRSSQLELLDMPGNSFESIRKNMQELHVINHWLGGHAITLQGVRNLLSGNKNLSICEIGCGGADNLKVISNWAARNGIRVNCTGIDINPDCIAFARAQFPEANYFINDYRDVVLDNIDIVFSSLFCHHFSEDDLVEQLKWMKLNSSAGFFINDLHRHPIAFYSIKVLTQLFSRSSLVKNDAPLSVQRGFIKKDWKQLLQRAGINNASIQWKWAFRWLICSKH